jgi:hypothetical protein
MRKEVERVNTATLWRQPLTRPAACDHIAQAYQDESFLVEAVSHFVGSGLYHGDGVLVIPTAAHWDAVKGRLAAEDVDVDEAVRSGQLVILDAEQTLSQFMTEGMPDWLLFKKLVGGLIEQMRQKHRMVRAFGEMVNLLRQSGNREATLCLEEFWNKLIKFHGISLFCAYHLDPLDITAYGGPLEDICRAHTHLIPTRHYEQLDCAVSEASNRVLDASLVGMLHTLAHIDLPETKMPFGQAVLLWLKKNMPLTADRVLSQVRGVPQPLTAVSRDD